MTDILRVIVVDDDPLQLELVERALPPDFFVVCPVGSLDELAQSGPAFGAHVVLVDVNLAGVPADRTVAAARGAAPQARVVLYSAWESSRLRTLAQQLGADGYISKSESVFTIGSVLRDLHRGV